MVKRARKHGEHGLYNVFFICTYLAIGKNYSGEKYC